MISGGDALSCYAHFALQRLHLLPGEFAALDDAEKAFVIASIRQRVEDEQAAADKAKGG